MTLQQVQKLKEQIQIEAANLEDQIKGRRNIHSLIKMRCSISSLNGISTRLERIENLLKLPSYDVVFIGEIGVGKTTAVCHLFNLILDEEKPVGTNGKTTRRFEEILSTGSGRTTIGEVVIQPSKTGRCYLTIEPYSNDEVREFIVETCHYFWYKVHPDSSASPPEVPPAELLRAIRNMTHLRETRIEGKLVDQAIELAQAHASLTNFTEAILNQVNLDARQKTQLKPSHPLKTVPEEKRWLKDNFAALNLGKIAGYSLPKRILVHVTGDLINFEQYPRLNSIIDTRGLDGGRDRKDLEAYIRGKDNAICLFAEEFKAAPSNVSGLIKKYLTQESRDIDTKLALLVLPHKGQAENVVGLDGKVENRAAGIEVRSDQIMDSFARDNIKFIPQNVLFYDALQFYDEEQALKSYYEVEDVEIQRRNVLESISHLIEARESALFQEVEAYKVMFEQIKAGGVLSQEEENLVTNLKKKIEQHRSLNFSSNFENNYMARLKSYNVMVFRAINNRFGIYELRGKDIYHDASDVAEVLLKERLAKDKENIIGAIALVEQHAAETSGLKPVMQILREQVDEYFEDLVIGLSKEISEVIEESLSPQCYSNEFWAYAQNRWGQGSGYRDDVLSRYKGQLADSNRVLTSEVQKAWEQEFMEKTLAFFNEPL